MKIYSLDPLFSHEFWEMLWNTHPSSLLFGLVGFLFVLFILSHFIFFPIRRDIRLARKNYWVWVFLFTLAIAAAMQLWGVMYSHISSSHVGSTPSQPWTMLLFFLGAESDSSFLPEVGLSYMLMTLIKIFVINGILVATLVGLFDRRISHYRAGEIRYSKLVFQRLKNRYAVVIGFNEVTATIIKDLLSSRENNLACILLQTNRNASEVRNILESQLSDSDLNKVIIYTAYRDSEKELHELHLPYAFNIYILGEQSILGNAEAYHDTINMKCLHLVAQILQDYKKSHPSRYRKKPCRVMFEYQTTQSVLQFSDVSDVVRETLRFIPFNRYECWARKVLVENSVDGITYVPLDGYDGLHYDSSEHVHLIIVGMSKMGVALGIQCLFQAHYPNYVRDPNLRTRITFIDTHADKEMLYFQGRYATLFELIRHRFLDANQSSEMDSKSDHGWIDPMQQPNCKWKHLSDDGKNFLDVEIEFVKGELESEGVRRYLVERSQDPISKLSIAICFPNANQAIATSLYMPTEVYENPNLQQVLVYQREAATIVENISEETKNCLRYDKLLPFGMVHGNYMDDRTRYWKGVLTNAVYNATQTKHPLPMDLNNNADEALKSIIAEWEALKECKKISNKLFADSIHQKLRCNMVLTKKQSADNQYDEAFIEDISRTLKEHKDVIAECEHNRWNIEQLLMGFSPIKAADDHQLRHLVREGANDAVKAKKAALKNSPAKVHPNICDFDHLDEIDPYAKTFDELLNNAIPDILLRVGKYQQFIHRKS